MYVQFIINEDGTITNTKVMRGLGYSCDEEALRLIRNMPCWQNPTHSRKKPLKEMFTQPVLFKLE